eukprot:scaffold144614_cov53-Attheya_sp.AAC.2
MMRKTQTMPRRKSKNEVNYGKAQQAPKSFKFAYMFFSTVMHPEIRARLGHKGAKKKTTAIAKLVSIEWEGLSQEERAIWGEKARRDKIRFEMEKNAYNGPWKVEIKKKEPSMPNPPGSAFFDFANSNQSYVQSCDPRFKSKDIGRVLAKMWNEEGEEERTSYTYMDRGRNRRETHETKMKPYWTERRSGYEGVVAEQVPEAEMRADETVLLDPADNHHEEEAVQQNNEAREESCATFDRLLDDHYMNNAIKHATMNWEPNLEADRGTNTDEVAIPLVTYGNEEEAAQQQHFAPQQQQGAFALFHDTNDNMKCAPHHMNFEPNTVFCLRSDSSQHDIFICVFLSADKYKHVDEYTAAAQFGSFDLHSKSSGPGLLKNGDPEMRQLYLDLAMLVC